MKLISIRYKDNTIYGISKDNDQEKRIIAKYLCLGRGYLLLACQCIPIALHSAIAGSGLSPADSPVRLLLKPAR